MEISAYTVFYEESTTFPGVRKIAGKVRKDIELVTGHYPDTFEPEKGASQVVIYGTAGHSDILDYLERRKIIDLQEIRGRREVYSFQVLEHPMEGIEQALVIAGSDKRGTIYGLFHLSEVLGVSPLVNWNHVWPKKQEKVILTDKDNIVSREPSVKYRGFFINDEWPAFGNWAKTHFGGINAECYERVFELLLRLKGNYLWPAMWASNFNLDGPGLRSAELADEYGIVMSTSHHEPCMRSGAEYGMVRGKDSVYGDAWDFRSNPEGITRFWRDGLERNKAFENVITVGMRGENDTALLEGGTSLKENIELLRRILQVQNQLIRECVHPDVMQVPRQIVLFTEVEEFFYGNKETPGLIGDPELEGVTLMLSDNNVGATRTLPSEQMRSHRGGYGMYYHMDMHGGPYSFQWIGSTYLPKLWEQMTQAYEYGVQEIWVTNIGDIGTQEYGLSFFLDLAYDIDRWGGQDAAVTEEYTRKWLAVQFGDSFPEEVLEQLFQVFMDYTGLLACRKHEVMNEKIFHPLHFGEAERVLEKAERILKICNACKANCPEEKRAAFISLVYYPACGTANLMKMWILAGRNALYAEQNRVEANDMANQVEECIRRDDWLTQEYHTVEEGYFYGFGLSEHIGFTHWCDEDAKYPKRIYVRPANQPRMIVSRIEDEHYMTGGSWTDRPQVWRDGLRQDVEEIVFVLACASSQAVTYQIRTDCPWISFSSMEGVVEKSRQIRLHIHRERFQGKAEGSFSIRNVGFGEVVIRLEAENKKPDDVQEMFLESDGYICMEASHFQRKVDVEKGGFKVLRPYGRTGSAIKVYPVTADFLEEEKRPYTEYRFWVEEAGNYRLRLYMAATTPVVYERKQYTGFSLNDGEVRIVNTVKEEERQFFGSRQWEEEALDQIKITESRVECRKGINTLRIWGMSPAVVPERILLYRENVSLPESYLGPRESFCYCPDIASGSSQTDDGRSGRSSSNSENHTENRPR